MSPTQPLPAESPQKPDLKGRKTVYDSPEYAAAWQRKLRMGAQPMHPYYLGTRTVVQGRMRYRSHDVTWIPCWSGAHVGTLQTRVYGPAVAANGYRRTFKTFYCKSTRGMCRKIDLLLAGKRRNPYPPAAATVIHERLRATLSKQQRASTA